MPDLSGIPVYVGAGRADPIVPTENTERLVEILEKAGAEVSLGWQPGGHGLQMPEVQGQGMGSRAGCPKCQTLIPATGATSMAERPTGAQLTVPIRETDHVRGPSTAPVTLVEYGDFECPYTRRARPVVERLGREFGDTLCFVYRNFPLTEIHPHAQAAAEAAEAASSQNRFWQMHDTLFANQRHLESEDLRRYASQLDLDPEQFVRELEDGKRQPP